MQHSYKYKIYLIFNKILVLFERLTWGDFSSIVETSELGYDSTEFNRCQSTPPYCKNILKRELQHVGQSDSIIDIGCGKGAMLAFFSRFNFGKMGGVLNILLLLN